MERFSLSDAQARPLSRCVYARSDGTRTRQAGCRAQRAGGADRYFNDVLGSRELQMKIVKDELLEVKAKYGDERRSEIVYASEEFTRRISTPTTRWSSPFRTWAISNVRRWPNTVPRTGAASAPRAARRATRISSSISIWPRCTIRCSSSRRKAVAIGSKVYEIPEGTRSSKGRAIQNVIQIEPDDKVRAYINVKRLDDAEYVNNNYIIMCTKDGTIKEDQTGSVLASPSERRQCHRDPRGRPVDRAKLTSGSAEVMIAAREGKAIRFNRTRCVRSDVSGPVCAVFRSTKATRWSA